MKLAICVILSCLCLIAVGCAQEAPPVPTVSVTVSPAPSAELPSIAAPTATPVPPVEPEKLAFTPEALAGELWTKGELTGLGQSVLIDTPAIVEILEAYGEKELSARFREDEALWDNAMYLGQEMLCYTDSFLDNGESIPFAAIFFNNHRIAYCLVMENRGEWRFGGYFECGEVARFDTEGAVSVHTAQTTDKGPQTWLLVNGLTGTGTGMTSEDCTWYNLNSGRTDIRYITRNFDINARPLPYQITSVAYTHDQFYPGGYPVEIVYTCRFGVAPGEDWGLYTDSYDIANAGEEDAIIAESTQYFAWEDGALWPVDDANSLYNEREVLASTFINICSDQFFELEDHGTKAEKAWAKDVRQLANEQNAAFITLTEQSGNEHTIERCWGSAKAPRFDNFWEMNPTVKCPGGAPIELSFIETPDRGYTLTRYAENGASEVVPIDNGVFLAQESAGTMLYTLEGNWYYGKFGFDFNVTVTSDGKAASPFEPEMTSVLERARDYAKQITGVDFSKASGTAILREWKTEMQIDGAFDEWGVELLWPNSNIQTSIRFEPGGNMTFFALFTLGEQKEEYIELPLAPAPENMGELDAVEKVRAWSERLPIMRMAEFKRGEIARKNVDYQYNGRRLTVVKLRYGDGSVLTCNLDDETGRLAYFCLYTKEML